MNKLVSIIMPVYNTPINMLERSLNSILLQDYNEYEVIVIDDGSNSKIANWLDKYSKDNKKIKIIHQINSGVSAARNKGIVESNGEYITFIDADDYINKWFLSEGIKYIEENNIDVICENMKYNYKSNISILTNVKDKLEALLTDSIVIDDKTIKISQAPWGKIYKKNVIDMKCLFDSDLKYGEDSIFNTNIFVKNIKVGVVAANWYNYSVNECSAMNINTKEKNILFINEHIKLINKFLSLVDRNTDDQIKYVYMRKIINILDFVYEESIGFYLDNAVNEELYKMIDSDQIKYVVKKLSSNKGNMKRNEKITLFLCKRKLHKLIIIKKKIRFKRK